MGKPEPTVVVVGSLNLDYIASVERLPAPGETIAARGLVRRFGGKGANQAIAAGRQGCAVRMIGNVGDDADGESYVQRLKAESVNVSGIGRCKTELTGTALIAVDVQGENFIIVASGANGALGPSNVVAQRAAISRADALLLQFEVPEPAILAAIRCANRAGVPVVLNPSPYRPGFPWGACKIDTLIVNDGEAKAIFGNAQCRRNSAESWLRTLARFNLTHLIITRGAKSTLCFSQEGRIEEPVLRVKPVDTVGAGDAFAGAFAARRAQGCDLRSAIRLANCAGALATLKTGAQESIPGRLATGRAARSLGAGG